MLYAPCHLPFQNIAKQRGGWKLRSVGLLERFNLTAECMFNLKEAHINAGRSVGRSEVAQCFRMDFCNMSRARMGDSVQEHIVATVASVLELP
jgi:hypothetical protein